MSVTGRIFSYAALGEAITWVGLLIGMVLKYGTETTALGVVIFGRLHGGMFLIYLVIAIIAAIRLRWPWWVTVLAILAAVPPLVTIPLEIILKRTRRLRPKTPATSHQDVTSQRETAELIPVKVWDELKVRKRRRKKHLRALMAPLADGNVAALEVEVEPQGPADPAPEVFELRRADYDAVRPETDVESSHDVFDVEARMSAMDFDDPTKWRVRTIDVKRGAVMEDDAFLAQVADGLAIRKNDIFDLRIREDR